MTESQLREKIEALASEDYPAPGGKRARQLRKAANALINLTSTGDSYVKRAFATARKLDAKYATKAKDDFTVSREAIAKFKSDDMGDLKKIFSSLEAYVYEFGTSTDKFNPIGYVTILRVNVKSPYDIDFARNFNDNLFIHRNLGSFDNVLIRAVAMAKLLTIQDESVFGTFRAVVISPTQALSLTDGMLDTDIGYKNFLDLLHDEFGIPDMDLLPELARLEGLDPIDWKYDSPE